MEKVIFLPHVEFFLNDLVDILFENEYFGFREDAIIYTRKIKIFIEENISNYPAKISPEKFKKHGEKYIIYKANQQTSWFIFYSQEEQYFFIKFITNNHTDFIKDFNP